MLLSPALCLGSCISPMQRERERVAQIENALNMMGAANVGHGVSEDDTPVLNGAAVAHVVSAQNCIAVHSTALYQK